MKFLYTDIDGVLCLGSETKSWMTKWGILQKLNKTAVKVYNEILVATDAEIIISSDWKDSLTLEGLGEYFEWQGIIKKPIGVTKSLPWKTMQFLERDRVKEILNHVEEHKPDIWVAVDDLDLHSWQTGELKVPYDKNEYKNDPHFVICTRWYEGIKQSGKKEEIIKKLNNGN